MSEHVFVSVLMTSYNREKYIAQAIESVLASDHENFELIIVDDASSDDTVKIAGKYTDSRIKLFVNEKNLGQFTNRNKAISLAQYDLIKFIDSDDEMMPGSLKIMVESMLRFPDAGIGVPLQHLQLEVPCCLNPHDSVLLHYRGGHHLSSGPSGTIFTKKALQLSGSFEKEYGILADTLLNIKMASDFPTVVFPNDLILWRRHEGQITEGQKARAQMVIERDRIMKASLNYGNCPLTDKEKGQVLQNFVKINSIHFFKFFASGRFAEAIKIKRKTGISFLKLTKAVLFKTKASSSTHE